MNLSKIKMNPNNPRVIKDDKFERLVKSLKELPEMVDVRPIVVNKDYVVLGGNMRLKAMREAGWKEAPVAVVDWSDEKQHQFIVKDNIQYGEWDWKLLKNDWSAEELSDWGMVVPEFNEEDLDRFFEEEEKVKVEKHLIILDYSEDEYNRVIEKLKEYTGSREKIFYELLGL